MAKYLQLNYDESAKISKDFKDEGEDITRLHLNTRQRVEDLRKEWIGEGADSFFNEMETELLPALERASLAMFAAQDVLDQVLKTIHDADEETTGYFGNDGDTGLSGDFGASGFAQALSAQDAGAQNDGSQNAGAGASAGAGTGASGAGTAQQSQGAEQAQDASQASESQSGGSGGGGGTSSQGLQGDLKQMGVGLVDQTPQNASAGGSSGGAQNLPDHIFGNASAGPSVDNPPPPASGGASSTGEPSSGNAAGAQAGVAGIAGSAAVAGAAKVIKEQADDEKK